MRDCRELLSSLYIGEPGRHELLMVNSALVMEEADGIGDSWPTTAALLVLDADSASQHAIRELALRFQYGAVSVLPLEQPGDAARILAQANSAVIDLVVLCRARDLTALDRIGPRAPGMRLLVHNLPSTPDVPTLHSEEDAMFDGFVSSLDDPLGSAVKTFQMLASLRAPGTLNCMDHEDFLSVFVAGRAVRVVTVDAPVTDSTPAGWSDAHVLTNGTDVVIVFDSRTGRLNTIKEILNTVRACPRFHEDEGPSLRYLGTKKYFHSRA